MTGKELEIAFLRAASAAGLIVDVSNVRDDEGASCLIDCGLEIEWRDRKPQPFGLFRHYNSDETDGFAGREQAEGRFDYLEELIEAALIRIIQIRLEDVTSDDLLA